MIKEVAAMRKHIFFLVLILSGCGGGGDSALPFQGNLPVNHVPSITQLVVEPQAAAYMEGDGSVTVTAAMNFSDIGEDLQTLLVKMPDGVTLEFEQAVDTDSGTLTEDFFMATDTVGAFNIEFWLLDKAGNTSKHLSVSFLVVGDVQAGDWTKRLSGLPYALNDVVWDGDVFIAVGGDGTVLTSPDGLTWTGRDSLTDASLSAVGTNGTLTVAVGSNATVLLSTDHGTSWSKVHDGDNIGLRAVTVTPSMIVVGGMDNETGASIIGTSEDEGGTWEVADSWPLIDHFVTELIYVDGLFVAGTDVFDPDSDARVRVSNDGKTWNDIILRNEVAAIYSIVHDGSQFVAVGSHGTIFGSPDGYNWTEFETPVEDVDYLSAAWDGSKLAAAGGISWWFWWLGTPSFELPVGISTTDGGETWQLFDIDGYYQSRGMAWGDGRFVSVGQSTPISGEGAIYTTD